MLKIQITQTCLTQNLEERVRRKITIALTQNLREFSGNNRTIMKVALNGSAIINDWICHYR
ncbi:hypothetical protein FRX31_035333 [Thalictrum thalictroides]|uniref:Uncharacterized protein n=1 Tax=Thalictrum thalictroides TaxID=46969 RepID=A0A7J6US29_THATH|nr:hypothetical protein FRX31_035333 [Thalictrum thalictroides]